MSSCQGNARGTWVCALPTAWAGAETRHQRDSCMSKGESREHPWMEEPGESDVKGAEASSWPPTLADTTEGLGFSLDEYFMFGP